MLEESELSQGELAICRQLQKFYRLVYQHSTAWKEAAQDTEQTLSSLVNRSEQLECISKVDTSVPPLSNHKDVKCKLQQKIASSMDKLMTDFKQKQTRLEESGARLTKTEEGIRELYGRYASQVSVEALCQRTSLRPSTAEMMQQVQDVESMYFTRLETYNYLLTGVNYEDPATTEALRNFWKGMDKEEQDITDILGLVSFFLAEKL